MANGWNVANEVTKWVKKGGSLSSTKSDLVRGAAQGAVRAVGDVATAFIDANTRKDVLKKQLAKDIQVDKARLELNRHNDIVRSFVDAKSPAGLVAAIVGAATAPRNYRDITAKAIDTSNL